MQIKNGHYPDGLLRSVGRLCFTNGHRVGRVIFFLVYDLNNEFSFKVRDSDREFCLLSILTLKSAGITEANIIVFWIYAPYMIFWFFIFYSRKSPKIPNLENSNSKFCPITNFVNSSEVFCIWENNLFFQSGIWGWDLGFSKYNWGIGIPDHRCLTG